MQERNTKRHRFPPGPFSVLWEIDAAGHVEHKKGASAFGRRPVLRQHRTKIVHELRRQSDHLWSCDSGKGKLVRHSRKAAMAEKVQANPVQRARVPRGDRSEPTEPAGETRRPVFVRCCLSCMRWPSGQRQAGFRQSQRRPPACQSKIPEP